jgi:Zn-dependent M28 family amino/carboxypeptidase
MFPRILIWSFPQHIQHIKPETVKTTSIAILSAAALAASTHAAPAAKPAVKPAVPATQAVQIEPSHLSHDVKVLSSDEFEGRGPNTPGEAKTVAYLINQFEAAGLKPGGDLVDGKRSWTQDVPLGRFEIKGPVELSVKGGGKEETLTQGEQIAVRASMTGAKNVDFKDAPLVFVGYGVTAPERKWDDFKGQDLKGKLAVVLINDPDFETGKGEFGGKAMTYYGRWTYKYEELARRGALGTIIVHETAPASYGWATVKNSNTNVMYDVVRKNPLEAHAPVEAWIQRDVAADLFKRAGLDFDKLKKSAQSRSFKPVELTGVAMSGRYAVDAQVITSKNVIAVREGSQHPDQYVIYSAHWDHLGIGLPDAKGDRIYNGAVDNATGVAALLEIARVVAAAPAPKRSMVFLAVTAEEKGLLGSEYYAANPVYPLAKTVGVINMDGQSPYGRSKDFTISGSAKLELLELLKAKAKQANLRYTPDPKTEAGYFFRSDHFPFAKRGVPALSFGSGQDWEQGGVAAGKREQDRYTAERYHQPADEWQSDWTFEGMARDLGILYAVGRELADSNTWPNWARDSEFRAARDQSAAERK